MKKVFTLVALASLSLVACGPSAEEVAAKAKVTADSIAAYETEQAAIVAAEAQRVVDSTSAVAAEAAKAQAIADSIAAASTKGGKKK